MHAEQPNTCVKIQLRLNVCNAVSPYCRCDCLVRLRLSALLHVLIRVNILQNLRWLVYYPFRLCIHFITIELHSVLELTMIPVDIFQHW